MLHLNDIQFHLMGHAGKDYAFLLGQGGIVLYISDNDEESNNDDYYHDEWYSESNDNLGG